MMKIKSWMIAEIKRLRNAEAEAGGRIRRRVEQAECGAGGGRRADGGIVMNIKSWMIEDRKKR